MKNKTTLTGLSLLPLVAVAGCTPTPITPPPATKPVPTPAPPPAAAPTSPAPVVTPVPVPMPVQPAPQVAPSPVAPKKAVPKPEPEMAPLTTVEEARRIASAIRNATTEGELHRIRLGLMQFINNTTDPDASRRAHLLEQATSLRLAGYDQDAELCLRKATLTDEENEAEGKEESQKIRDAFNRDVNR